MHPVRPINSSMGGLVLACAILAGCAGGEEAGEPAPPPTAITMDGERLFPESITADAAGNIYTSSQGGTIYRAMAGSDRAEAWVEPDASNGLASLFGVLVDDARQLLWVCSNPSPERDSAAAVKAFSLDTAAYVASHPFPTDAGPALCNDMALDAHGNLFATDTVGGRIFRLLADGEDLQLFAEDEELGGIDGIAFAGNGTLYVNSVQRNTLMRIDRDREGEFRRVRVLSTSQEMDGPDGLRLLDGNRFLQSEGPGGRITLVTIRGNSAGIESLVEGIDYPGSVVPLNGRAWYPVGKIRFFFDPELQEQVPGDFTIESIALPEEE